MADEDGDAPRGRIVIGCEISCEEEERIGEEDARVVGVGGEGKEDQRGRAARIGSSVCWGREPACRRPHKA